MTVQEILIQAIDEYGQRNQLTVEQALLHLNTIQKMCFGKDLMALLSTDQFLEVNGGNPKGPYPYPSLPPCRKFVGVTTQTEDVILGLAGSQGFNIYEPVRISVVDKTFKLLFDPSFEPETYRVVYYRRAPLIRSLLDNANLVIPEEFHDSVCVQGILALSDRDIFGENYQTNQTIDRALQPYFEYLEGSVDPGNSSGVSEGFW